MLLMSGKLEKQLQSFDEKSEVGEFKKSSRPACRQAGTLSTAFIGHN